MQFNPSKGLTKFPPHFFQALGLGCPKLNALTIHGICLFKGAELFELTAFCGNLTKLDLKHCWVGISKAIVQQIRQEYTDQKEVHWLTPILAQSRSLLIIFIKILVDRFALKELSIKGVLIETGHEVDHPQHQQILVSRRWEGESNLHTLIIDEIEVIV